MTRIGERFADLRARGRIALAPYLTGGDPSPAATPGLMHSAVAAGADLIEVGVPFSDPMADGPVIQRASERALRAGSGLAEVLEMVAEFRDGDGATPVVLMSYLNPIEVMGHRRFADAAAGAGVDGVLVVDLPVEEAEPLLAAYGGRLDPVFLIAPTTGEDRAAQICRAGAGFLYYVAVKGVTGSDALEAATLAAPLARLRRLTELPIGVGFGVRDGPSAAAVARVADAVIVGSALVARIEAAGADADAARAACRAFVGELRAALDAHPRATARAAP